MKLNLSRFFQTAVNVFIFSKLHPIVGYFYIQALGWLYYSFKPAEKRAIKESIRDMIGDQDPARLHRVTRQAFRGIFLHYYEKMFAAFRGLSYVKRFVDTRFRVQGLDLIRSALEGGKGVIVCTAHFGGLEFIPWVIGVRGEVPMDVIMECATPRLKRALHEKVLQTGIRLFSIKDGESVLARALATLASNRVLMTECDEVDTWHRRRNRTIPLFGKELYFDNTLDFLARRSGAPVIAAFLKRTGFLRYEMVFEDISWNRQPQSVAHDAMILWEKYVTRYPEQWFQWKKWQAMKVA
jgi:Kdo2-lipid IVA lauroyltransferase/acyltransferase